MAVAVLLLLALAYDLMQDVEREFTHTSQMTLRLTRVSVANTERLLRDSEQWLETASHHPDITAMGSRGCARFANLRQFHTRYVEVLLADLAGNVICSILPAQSETAAPAVQERLLSALRADPRFSVGQPYRLAGTGKWALPLAYPVHDKAGRFSGVIGVSIDLTDLRALLDASSAELPPGTESAIADRAGAVIVGSAGSVESVSSWVKIASEGRDGVTRAPDARGADRILAYLPVGGANWYAFTAVPLSQVLSGTLRLILEKAAFGLIVVLVAMFLARRVGRRIEAPIRRIAEAARQVEQQRDCVRAPVEGVEELVEVATQFNRTLDVLEQERRCLQESQAQMNAILESMGEVAWSTSADQERLYFVSPVVETIYGRGVDEFMHNPGLWWEMVHGEDRRKVSDFITRVREHGDAEVEYRITRPDLAERSLYARARMISGPDRQARIHGIIRDITERRQAERRLRQSEARLAGIIASAMDAVISIDVQQRIVLFNPAAEKMFGYNAGEVIGRPAEMLLPERFRIAHRGQVERYARIGVINKRMSSGRGWGRRSDGTEFPIEASISRLEVGEEIILTVILRDISARVRDEESIRDLTERLERRVAERTEQLQRANRELEAFSYSVSHDLRAPLRAINGFATMLSDNERAMLSEQGRLLLDRVKDNAIRMSQLIDDLLRFSRISRSDLVLDAVDMQRLACQVAEELSEQYPGIELCIEAMPQIMGDRAMLRQMYVNLLGNACKFSAGKGKPRVEAGLQGNDGGQRVFYVKDNGAGFDMTYSDKLFGVFQRLHSEAEYGGTGVGLAIVKRIVERHGGRIWAESAPGQGASFYFTLG